MNQREPTSAPLGAGQALPCLALLLLPLLAVVRAWSRPNFPQWSATARTKPYLVTLGAPPLRFLEPAPPPDLTTKPPAAAPPQPAAAEDPFDLPVASDVSTFLPPPPPPPATALPETDVTTDPAPVTPEAAPEAVVEPPPSPPPILPDEMRPQTRPEDFLPFFQIPVNSSGDAGVIVPVPRTPAAAAPLPLSSATYTQTPR